MDGERPEGRREGRLGGITRRGQFDAAAHAYLAGHDPLKILQVDETSLEGIALEHVQQRAHELLEERQRHLAMRISNLLLGRPVDGK